MCMRPPHALRSVYIYVYALLQVVSSHSSTRGSLVGRVDKCRPFISVRLHCSARPCHAVWSANLPPSLSVQLHPSSPLSVVWYVLVRALLARSRRTQGAAHSSTLSRVVRCEAGQRVFHPRHFRVFFGAAHTFRWVGLLVTRRPTFDIQSICTCWGRIVNQLLPVQLAWTCWRPSSTNC